MPLTKIQIRPGFNTQLSQTANESGWFNGNLVRWKNGLLEKVGGWLRLFSSACAGTVRALHAWEDLTATNDLLIAGDGGLQVYDSTGTLTTLSFAAGVANTLPYLTYTSVVSNPIVQVTTGITLATPGETITLLMHQSIGGILFSAGHTFTVASVVDSSTGTITFNMGTNATLGGDNQGSPTFTFASGTPTIATVVYPNHGLSPGGTYIPDLSSGVDVSQGSPLQLLIFSLPAGTHVNVNSVIDTNTFTFLIAPYVSGSVSLSSPITIAEGEININGTLFYPSILTIGGFSSSSPPQSWWLDNLGNNGIITYTNGAIYVFSPPVSGGSTVSNAGSDAPQQNNGMFVAMPQAQIVVFGTQSIIGTVGTDPLLIRWSDAGSFSVWTASATNQAGSYRLSRGSKIIAGLQAPQTSLLWTDIDLWSMSYIGPPLIYGFTVMGSGCGIVGPHAAATLGRTTYWIGTNSFWMFGDTGVQPVPCPVWDQFFTNINMTYAYKCVAAANSSFHEMWFFYPSGVATECNAYVKYRVDENLWDFGTLTRSAWLDNSVFGTPLGADGNFHIQQHESGYDDDGSAMANVFAESGYGMIADGDQMMLITRCIPDFKWFGSGGSVNITLGTTNYPADSEVDTLLGAASPTTEWLPARARARQIAIRLDWAAATGFGARLEALRFVTAAAGRRPS